MAHETEVCEAPIILPAPSPTDMLDEIVAHLSSAIIQSVSTDDQIIMGHVQSAQVLAVQLLKAARREA